MPDSLLRPLHGLELRIPPDILSEIHNFSVVNHILIIHLIHICNKMPVSKGNKKPAVVHRQQV